MYSNHLKRNSNIELLRFLLMILICIWHTMVHGFNLKNMGNGPVPDINSILLMGACVPAVDTFILISGYYGIKLSTSKLLRLIFQTLIITNTIILVKFIFFDGSFSFYDQVLPISSGVTLWFMTVYVIIMLLSPIINAGIDSVDSKVLGKILFVLFFVYCIVQYRLGMGGANLTIMFLIYCLGRYMNKVKFSLSFARSLCLWTVSFISIISLLFFHFFNGKYGSIWILLSYNNPLVIIMALSIFFLFLSCKKIYINEYICSFMGRHSLSIYLFSEMIGYTLYGLWARLFITNILICLIAIVAFACLCEFVDVIILSSSKALSNLVLCIFHKLHMYSFFLGKRL